LGAAGGNAHFAYCYMQITISYPPEQQFESGLEILGAEAEAAAQFFYSLCVQRANRARDIG
jgi:hypothetical protein